MYLHNIQPRKNRTERKNTVKLGTKKKKTRTRMNKKFIREKDIITTCVRRHWCLELAISSLSWDLAQIIYTLCLK